MFNQLLPGSNDRTVKYYYLSEAAMNLWFIAAVWYFVFRHFVSVQQIGILEIIVFSIGLFAEIPSGALADSIGRRKTLILGGIFLVLGTLGTAFSYNLMTLILSQALWFIGYAFYSGANEALVYDKLLADKKEADWPKISARKNGLVVIVTTFSVLAGGFLYNAHFQLPFITQTFAILLFLFSVWRYPKDTTLKVINKSVHSASEYWKNLVVGTRELLKPKLRFLLWGVLAFTTLNHAYEFGVLRPLILSNRGYEGFEASVLSFILHIFLFILFLALPKLFGKNVSEKQVLLAVLAAAISYTLLAFATQIWIVGVIVIVFTLLASTITWWTSIYINRHVSSKYRATALSTWAMLQKVPYILLVGIITNLSQQTLSIFILVSGIVVGLFAMGTLLLLHKLEQKQSFD